MIRPTHLQRFVLILIALCLSGCLTRGRVRFGMTVVTTHCDEGDGPPAAMRLLLALPLPPEERAVEDVREELRLLRGHYVADRFHVARLELATKTEKHRQAIAVLQVSRELDSGPIQGPTDHLGSGLDQDIEKARGGPKSACELERECELEYQRAQERWSLARACATRILELELALEDLRRAPGVATRLRDVERIHASMEVECARAGKLRSVSPFSLVDDIDWPEQEARTHRLEDKLERFRKHVDSAFDHLAAGEHIDLSIELDRCDSARLEFHDEIIAGHPVKPALANQ